MIRRRVRRPEAGPSRESVGAIPCMTRKQAAGSCLSLIDSCITQLREQGPSGTCNESKEEEERNTCITQEHGRTTQWITQDPYPAHALGSLEPLSPFAVLQPFDASKASPSSRGGPVREGGDPEPFRA